MFIVKQLAVEKVVYVNSHRVRGMGSLDSCLIKHGMSKFGSRSEIYSERLEEVEGSSG